MNFLPRVETPELTPFTFFQLLSTTASRNQDFSHRVLGEYSLPPVIFREKYETNKYLTE